MESPSHLCCITIIKRSACLPSFRVLDHHFHLLHHPISVSVHPLLPFFTSQIEITRVCVSHLSVLIIFKALFPLRIETP